MENLLSSKSPIPKTELLRLDEELVEIFGLLNITRPAEDDSIITRCGACQEEDLLNDIVRAPCNHEFCIYCLEALFAAAMSDNSLFPPRCCQESIPIEVLQEYLDAQFISDFQRKKVEFDTVDKTYCCALTCSTFVEPENIIDDVATCSVCGAKTCTLCKAATHEEGDCENDTALEQLLGMAEENEWQRCSACRSIVDLEQGCNHITCRCGYQFCYVCGAEWKTCTCDYWDEHHIYDDEAELSEQEFDEDDQEADDEEEGNYPVEQQDQYLHGNHECNHTRWRYVAGAHQCDECGDMLYQFILECRRCHIQACARCRDNRL